MIRAQSAWAQSAWYNLCLSWAIRPAQRRKVRVSEVMGCAPIHIRDRLQVEGVALAERREEE